MAAYSTPIELTDLTARKGIEIIAHAEKPQKVQIESKKICETCGDKEWGSNGTLPYIQSVLMHNLGFYTTLMWRLQQAIQHCTLYEIIEMFLPGVRGDIIRNAIRGGKKYDR